MTAADRRNSGAAVPFAEQGVRDGQPFVRLRIHAQPGASFAAIAGATERGLKVRLSRPPQDGEANEELLQMIADGLNLARRRVALISGHKSREKIVEIAGVDLNDVLVSFSGKT